MRASGASLVRGSCTKGLRMRCLEPSNAQRKLGGCHPLGVPVERGLLAARSSESVPCRQPLRPEQPKRRTAQCPRRGEFVETRRWAPASPVRRGAPRQHQPSEAAGARTVERAQAYRSTNKPLRSVRLGAFHSSACRCGPLCRLLFKPVWLCSPFRPRGSASALRAARRRNTRTSYCEV